MRRGSEAEIAAVAQVLAEAFARDPVWGWAYPMAVAEPARVAPVWTLWVRSAVARGTLWVTERCEAVSVWTPPGATELTDADAALFAPLTEGLIGGRAPQVLAAVDAFEAARPTAPEHHYLSLLGTADAHRGRGLGIALLATVLERIDAEHGAAYLESTNPANDARYARLGFRPHGTFTVEAAGAIVTTMWRPPRPG